jgi:glyoxylase-like metal-dependent hydrolase (beta-lactamase superfamily II)
MPAPSHPDVRVISIGCLAAHPLWNEREPVRQGHATTTLVRAGSTTIIVDPALPEAALASRLSERAGLRPSNVTHVFLTSFKPDARRGLGAFEHATWWVSKQEREGVGVPLVTALRHAVEQGNAELRAAIERDVALLHRCEEAPDTLAPGIDLFPLPGVTPGLCGLLVEFEESTTLICGDAVATVEHLAAGKILPNAADVAAAKASFAEALEIGDLLVLGRDNAVPSPGNIAED